jgi:hypothetical protein
VDLIFGAGKLDRCVLEAQILLGDWRERERNFGQLYLEHEPVTSPNRVFVEASKPVTTTSAVVPMPAKTSAQSSQSNPVGEVTMAPNPKGR